MNKQRQNTENRTQKIKHPGGIEGERVGNEKAPVDDKVDKSVDESVEEQKDVYSFPTRSRCPRCKTTDTIATETRGKIQRRQCQRAICRWKYIVYGTKI
ncbi:MAG: hypothetical protein ABSG99_02760 [Sedimentisphaerales bacterium]